MSELVDNVALAFKTCNQQRERIAELERQLAEEKKNFNALDDQYHRLGEKYEALQWQPIAKDNLPKVGDELFRIGADYPNDVDDIEAERGEYSTFRVYIKFGWTHFRPINPPGGRA